LDIGDDVVEQDPTDRRLYELAPRLYDVLLVVARPHRQPVLEAEEPRRGDQHGEVVTVLSA
jgi:hypothetical protein